MILINAPAPGTGKGLLAQSLVIPWLGTELETTPQQSSDAEWGKTLLAKLLESPSHILFDNLTGTIRSPNLECFLTSPKWGGRVLGESRTVRLRQRTIPLATANNLDLGGDLPRRVIWIHLDARMENPEERKPEDFKHPDLRDWAKENRSKLVWAILTLVQSWVSAGRKMGSETLGSFEQWASHLGGVLAHLGIPGFLKNVKGHRQHFSEDAYYLRQVVAKWFEEFGTNPVVAKAIFSLVEDKDCLPPHVVATEDPRARSQKFGRWLSKHDRRVVGSHQIIRGSHTRTGVRAYQLVELNPPKEGLDAAQVPAKDPVSQDHGSEVGLQPTDSATSDPHSPALETVSPFAEDSDSCDPDDLEA